MKYALLVLTAWCALGSTSLSAGTPKTIDARQFLVPLLSTEKANTTQQNAFQKMFMLQNDAAEQLFRTAPTEIAISNFTIPNHGEVTLNLTRTADVFDANTQFLVNTPKGKKRITVRPIVSFKGTIEGDPHSSISLHYSQGDLTGYIFHDGGGVTTIGRDMNVRSISGATPHFIAEATSSVFEQTMSEFICGNEFLPDDEGEMVRSMLMPSSLAKGESMQSLPLKEMKLAIVLREEIDSVLKLRSYTDEMIAQHFAKVVAAMSQAYEQDLRVRLYIGYFLAHNVDAPSGYLATGAYPGELLEEFSSDWSSGFNNVDRVIAHLYTRKVPRGGVYVGGIAYGGGGALGSRLCVKSHRGGYGVSTIDITPTNQIPGKPDDRNAFVWDVFVASHEMGHNVGSPHTHNCFWSPPVDTCQLKRDSTDACYDDPNLRRVRPGTIMSYCHLVNGSSTPLTFGTRVAERMRTWVDAASCIQEPTSPVVSITSPRGTESWTAGARVTIKFVSARVSNVNLDYSVNEGANWTEIIHNKPAVDSEYVWTVPAVAATRLWIRISDASNASVQNTSIAFYSVTTPFTIISPSGGERLPKNSSYNIRWANSTGSNVNVQFAADGVNFTDVATNIDKGVVTYAWNIPDVETETARVRIVSSGNTAVGVMSNQFAIGAPRFRLLLPRNGMSICNDVETQYNWDGDFIEKIRIQYSIDDGGTWKNALQVPTVEVADWEIFSRASSLGTVAKGTAIKLRVIDNATNAVLDTRDTITVDSCGAVVGVEELRDTYGQAAIVSISPNPASTAFDVKLSHASNAKAEIIIVDITGQVVSTMVTDLQGQGNTTVRVDLGGRNIASGTYQLVVRCGANAVSAPLTIVR